MYQRQGFNAVAQGGMRRADRAILQDNNRKGRQFSAGYGRAAGGGGTRGHRHLARIAVATRVMRSKRDCRFRNKGASVLRMGLGTGNAPKEKHEDQQKRTDH